MPHRIRFLLILTGLVAVLSFGLLGSQSALAATITVNDTGTAVADDGVCTLIEAIIAANTDTASGAAPGECAAGVGADIIELQASQTYTLTAVNNNDNGDNGLPSVTTPITINGNGATVTRGGGTPFRLFHISSAGDLSLNNLTVSGGQATSTGGGGIFSRGALTLNNATITGNGGGAALPGGGVEVFSGTANIINSTFSNNTIATSGTSHGGGLYISSATVTVSGTAFSGNTARRGGGIYASAGTVTLTNITVTNNNGPTAGGGIFVSTAAVGISGSSLTLNSPQNCSGTVTDNGGNSDDDGSCGFPPPTPGYGSTPAPGSTINVGSVAVGNTVTTTLTVSETGTADLDVSAFNITGADAADFSLTAGAPPFTITDGGLDHDVTIQCMPGALGLRTATLEFTTNDPANATVTYTLNCTGSAAPGYGSSPAPGSTINVGSAVVGNTVTTTLTVSETGTADLNVSAHSITGADAADFSLTAGAPPFTITDGGLDHAVTIQCMPSVLGLRTATLQFSTNDPANPTVNYTLNCTGTTTPTPGYGSTPAPNSTINVGSAVVGATVTTNLTVSETGTADLSVTIPGGGLIVGLHATDFTITSGPPPFTILDGGAARTVTIQCKPSATGLRVATLQFTTNDPVNATVSYTLNCTGTTAPTPGYSSAPAVGGIINIGSVPVGASASANLIVSETGAATLNVSVPPSGLISGVNATEFSIIGGSPPFSIDDGGAPKTVTVQCTPTVMGLRIATMTFGTNDPALPIATYTLNCTGIQPLTPTPVTPTVTPEPPTSATVINVKGLALRTGPYLGASMIGVARPGNSYAVSGQNHDEGIYTWYLITVGSKTGWASGRYLQVTGRVDEVPVLGSVFDTIDGAPDVGVLGVTRAVMNFRRKPSARTDLIEQIPWGGEVSIIGRTLQGGKNHWLQVRYEGKVGWIYAPYVTIVGPVTQVPIY